jgi:outer membrane protein TolC
MKVRALLVLLGLVSCHLPLQAQPATEPTTLQQVLDSSLRHLPRILAVQSSVESSQALVMAAEGIFDPRIDGSLGGRLGGYYDGHGGDAGLVQNFPLFNARAFAGYRISDGNFPTYEDGGFTLSGGEARAGVGLSLWRDRDIDERRASVIESQLELLADSQELNAVKLDVLETAYVAYARWLMAARLLTAYEELLQLADARGEALTTQVDSGAVAEILQVENDQAILQRRGLVVDAQRQLDMAAQQLALYLRDVDGGMQQPVYAPTLELPPDQSELLERPIPEIVAAVLERRPEIRQLEVAREQAGLDERLALNSMQPKVDLEYYAARDIGRGPVNLMGTDNVAKLVFSVPLRTRTASGKAAAARAEMDGIDHTMRQLQDQLGLDIRQALLNLDATRELEVLAQQELEVSRRLAEAEVQRFTAGISDFFLLNVRERQVGEAQLKRLQAALTHQVALATYYAATMSLSGFGIEAAVLQ